MTAYLDNNIFIYIENGALDIDDLVSNIDSEIDTFFYSSAHLSEADEISGDTEDELTQRINTRLTTIERITSCNYLHEDLNHHVFHQSEKPSVVLETIREVSFAKDAMKTFSNFITEKQKESVRASLGLETSKLNNYRPDEVIVHLNKKLKDWEQGHSFLELLEVGMSYHPSAAQFGLSNKIAEIFELLDMCGYWRDKPTEKSNYARFWDSSHAFFASFCDYFISDDKRTRNKARVVYDIYNIKTKVLSSKGVE